MDLVPQLRSSTKAAVPEAVADLAPPALMPPGAVGAAGWTRTFWWRSSSTQPNSLSSGFTFTHSRSVTSVSVPPSPCSLFVKL